MPFRFEGFDIWHKARAYASLVHCAMAAFPRHEDYGLRAQMSRAANSIVLNIAEGAGRATARTLDYYLEIAVASVFEVVAASALALDRRYISEEKYQELYEEGERLAKGINSFRSTLRSG